MVQNVWNESKTQPPAFSPRVLPDSTTPQLRQVKAESSGSESADRRLKRAARSQPSNYHWKRRPLPRPVTPPPAVNEALDYDGPLWTILEDQALLEAIRSEESMGHTLEKNKLYGGLRFNWEIIASAVNRVSQFYRSPRQCSLRYQTVVRPREDRQAMVIDPLTKERREVPFTELEKAHIALGRHSVQQQYDHDADGLRKWSIIGRCSLLNDLAKKQSEYKYSPKPPIERPWKLVNGFPPDHLKKLVDMKIETGLSPASIISNIEEKRQAMEKSKMELAEKKKIEERERPKSPSHPEIIVSLRQPAVKAGEKIVESRLPMTIPVPQLNMLAPSSSSD